MVPWLCLPLFIVSCWTVSGRRRTKPSKHQTSSEWSPEPMRYSTIHIWTATVEYSVLHLFFTNLHVPIFVWLGHLQKQFAACVCFIQKALILVKAFVSFDYTCMVCITTYCIFSLSQMTSWVCTEILSRESPSARATVIEHLINMARTCFRHNDMHCALSITLALKSTPIKRLTKTWDSVDRRVSILKKTLIQNFVSFTRIFHTLYVDFSYLYLSLLQCKQRFEKLKDVTDLQEKCRKLREQTRNVSSEANRWYYSV